MSADRKAVGQIDKPTKRRGRPAIGCQPIAWPAWPSTKPICRIVHLGLCVSRSLGRHGRRRPPRSMPTTRRCVSRSLGRHGRRLEPDGGRALPHAAVSADRLAGMAVDYSSTTWATPETFQCQPIAWPAWPSTNNAGVLPITPAVSADRLAGMAVDPQENCQPAVRQPVSADRLAGMAVDLSDEHDG